MSFQEEKKELQKLYKDKREWMQSTPTYGCWVYPTAYYIELTDLVLKYSN